MTSSAKPALDLVVHFCASWTMVVGLMALIGWLFDSELFKSLLPGPNPIKANAALCFVLAGLALFFRQHNRLLLACAAVIGVISSSTLLTYQGSIFDITQLALIQSGVSDYPKLSVGMSVLTACGFLVIMGALLLLKTKNRTQHLLQEALCLGLGFTAILALYVCLLDSDETYLSQFGSNVSVFTVLTLVVLSLGLLAARSDGKAAYFFSSGSGPQVARRFLPLVILLPLVLGWLEMRLEAVGWLRSGQGTIFITFGLLALMTISAWFKSKYLTALDTTLHDLNQNLEQLVLDRTEALRKSQEDYQILFNSMSEGFCIIELVFDEQQNAIDYCFLTTNPAFEKHEKLRAVPGKRMSELYPNLPVEQVNLDYFTNVLRSGVPVRYEKKSMLLESWFDLYVFPVRQRGENQLGVVIRDITQRKQHELEIEQLALYDQLTGLPNRHLLNDRLQLALARSERNQQPGVLVFIDLDHFKNVNDTLGHDAGDRLLQRAAQVLKKSVRKSDTVARIGGDEFVLLLEGFAPDVSTREEQVQAICDNIQTAFSLRDSLNVAGRHCTASMGATIFLGHQTSTTELFKQADMAMYQAKADGRQITRIFNSGIQHKILQRRALESELQEALEKKQLELYYQSQINARGQLIGFEALVRWHHPRHGLTLPGEFIAAAEQSGLIHELGLWVLQTACAQLKHWSQQPSTEHLKLAVNVSTLQVHKPDFADQVRTVLTQTGAPADRLVLEITESLLVENITESINTMHRIKALGVGFTLDDFGTGYSSLSYLRRLPLDSLKIDRSFIKELTSNANDAAIVQAILAMAHALGIVVVAEGVETQEQWQSLIAKGCQNFQGYLFSKPQPLAELVLQQPQA